MHLLKILAICSVLVISLGACTKKRYHVPTSSMNPTIPAGTDVIVDRSAYWKTDPDRWDVVTFKPPKAVYPGGITTSSKEIWIMRVVGMPGETVDFSGPKILIEGTPLKLPPTLIGIHYFGLAAMKTSSSGSIMKVTLAKDEYFVLGDNTTNANDSRFWGALPRSHIFGRFEALIFKTGISESIEPPPRPELKPK